MAQRYQFDLARSGRVDRGDDARQPAQVVGVVGDDQRVVGRVGGDGVVGRDHRPQHRHQVVGRLIVEPEHLRHHLVAAARRRADHRGRALQLGIGLGHDLGEAVALDHRVALHAQHRAQRLQRLRARHRLLRDQVHRAFHARVDHEVLAGGLADRLDHRVEVGIDEVEHHLVAVGRRDVGRRRRRTRGARSRLGPQRRGRQQREAAQQGHGAGAGGLENRSGGMGCHSHFRTLLVLPGIRSAALSRCCLVVPAGSANWSVAFAHRARHARCPRSAHAGLACRCPPGAAARR
ncbi:hypothetical protein D9M72_328370 [compost metagenome]